MTLLKRFTWRIPLNSPGRATRSVGSQAGGEGRDGARSSSLSPYWYVARSWTPEDCSDFKRSFRMEIMTVTEHRVVRFAAVPERLLSGTTYP